jgi:hypothetical protein
MLFGHVNFPLVKLLVLCVCWCKPRSRRRTVDIDNLLFLVTWVLLYIMLNGIVHVSACSRCTVSFLNVAEFAKRAYMRLNCQTTSVTLNTEKQVLWLLVCYRFHHTNTAFGAMHTARPHCSVSKPPPDAVHE